MLLVGGLNPLPAQAMLSLVGPVDPVTSFPSWYADTNGLALQICMPGTQFCPIGPALVPPTAGGEGFYNMSTSTVGPVTTIRGLEAAYVPALDGSGTLQQTTFQRTNYFTKTNAALLHANTPYTITDPFGSNVCTTDAGGLLPRNAAKCRFQVGGANLDFTAAVSGPIGPFLTYDLAAVGGPPPVGYIGDGVSLHRVIGSPNNFNMTRVEGPGINPGATVDGCPTLLDGHAFADCAESPDFILNGKIQPNGPAASTGVSAVDFGNVATTPADKTVNYTSTGSANAIVSSVALSGPGAADFTLTDGCTVVVAGIVSGSSCPITVAFTPQAGVASSASLTINDNTLGTGRVISLNGSSLPVTTLDRTSMVFPSQKTATTGSSDTVIVGNSGVSLLTATPSLTGTGAGHFKIMSNLCTAPVAPGGGCEIAVSFAPTTSGSKSASLVVTDNTGKASTVALSGTGTSASISVSPTSVAFANTATGSVSSGNVTVTNSGTAPAFISSITGSGDFAYAPTSSTCQVGTNLAAGAGCLTDVSFRPAVAGAQTGSLSMNIDGVTSMVSLSGTGITVVPAATAPGAPTLGALSRGNSSATVRWVAPASTGGSAITGYSVRVTNASTGVQIGALRSAAATARGLSVSGLVNGRAVRFQVRALNAVGMGANSALSGAVTPARTPSAPRIGTASSGAPRGAVNAAVRWAAPVSNGGTAVNGYVITAFRLNARGAVIGQVRSGVIASTRRSATMNLRAGSYRFKIQARNVLGLSSMSAGWSNRVTAR